MKRKKLRRNNLKKKLRSRLSLSNKKTKRTKKSSRNNKTVRIMMSRSTKNSKKVPKKTKTMLKTHKKSTKMWTAMLLHSKIKANRIMNLSILVWSISRSKRPSTSS